MLALFPEESPSRTGGKIENCSRGSMTPVLFCHPLSEIAIRRGAPGDHALSDRGAFIFSSFAIDGVSHKFASLSDNGDGYG
jgi:hypothetical protein